jgi:hypothetical protein
LHSGLAQEISAVVLDEHIKLKSVTGAKITDPLQETVLLSAPVELAVMFSKL